MSKKFAIKAVGVIAGIYVLLITLLYFYQEKFLFMPDKVATDYQFKYDTPFEELNFIMEDSIILNGLLFKADSSKGLVFYLHGNAGSLAEWGTAAKPFIDNKYDCFIIDYRGFGKSEGIIENEEQLHQDINSVYQSLLTRYEEKNVIIVGYSMGSGVASKLASVNHPKELILKAPYNNMAAVSRHHFPWAPTFFLRYSFKSDEFLRSIPETKITIFHGDEDNIIPLNCALKLQENFNENDKLIILKGQNHYPMTQNKDYQRGIAEILND